MRSIEKRCAALLMAVLLMLGVFAPMSAQAAQKITITPELLWAGCEYWRSVNLGDFPEDGKVLSVTASDPRIIKVVYEGTGQHDHYLMPLKKGKTKITVQYQTGSTRGTASAIFTVKNYPNPYKSITVDGKKINLKKYKYYFDINKYKKPTAKITLKLKKGWKIAYTDGISAKNVANEKSFKVENNKAFKIPKGKNARAYVFFTVENKNHESLQYGIRIYR